MSCTRRKESPAALVLGARGIELRWHGDGHDYALGFGERTDLRFEAAPSVAPGGMGVRIAPKFPPLPEPGTPLVLALPRQEVVFTFHGEPSGAEVYS